MRVKITLLASLREYLPRDLNEGDIYFAELNNDITIKELLSKLGIPIEMPKIIMINNRYGDLQDHLKEGDEITIFPPLCGG
jgi:molybdopterin converting factor small subunit